MRAHATGVIARKELGDAVRHRWLHLYAGLLGILGLVIAWYAVDETAALALESYGRTAASMTNLCLLLVPLVALVMGSDAIAGERDRGTLERLLAQPLDRGELLGGKLIGLWASLAGATLVAFVPATVALVVLTGAPPPLGTTIFPLVAVLLILPMLALGLLLSVTADSAAKALARAVLLWAWLVLLYDLLLLATLMSARLGIGFLLAALLVNPVHAARLLVVLALEPDLYLLGPAGAWLTETLSPGWTAALLVSQLFVWSALALVLAFAAFRLRRTGSARSTPGTDSRTTDSKEAAMQIVTENLVRVARESGARHLLSVALIVAASTLLACGGGDAGATAMEEVDDDVRPVDAEMLAHGAKVYQDNCAPCHGATGRGDGVGAASLDPKPRDHTDRAYMDTLSDESIAQVVKIGGSVRGFPNMPSHPHLKNEDLVALVAFVRTLSRGAEAVQVVELDLD